MHCLEAEDLRGDDVEEPVTPGDFSKILDAVGDQHVPVQGVTMPLFRTNKRAEIRPQPGRKRFLCLHELLRFGLAVKAASRRGCQPG